ncbi:MAG: DUF1223 domain-containing protein, partial [Thiobacillus sp.]|nr:DUF1223 domain-containing protein [Thiobacillus sp.]
KVNLNNQPLTMTTHHPSNLGQFCTQVSTLPTRTLSRLAATPATRGAQLYLALYENRLVSRVTAGENAARTLRHDYVVRTLAGPFQPGDTRHRFILRPDWQADQMGVAAFVVNAQGQTLQALARAGCP